MEIKLSFVSSVEYKTVNSILTQILDLQVLCRFGGCGLVLYFLYQAKIDRVLISGKKVPPRAQT